MREGTLVVSGVKEKGLPPSGVPLSGPRRRGNADAVALQLGRKIKALRTEKKMTQEQLAAASGVSYKHIQYLEGSRPTIRRL